MSAQPARVAEARCEPRLKVPAMYTLLRARRVGDAKYTWTGYIYDISLSGMRFELDEPVEPGAEIEVRGMLPAGKHTTFRAIGTVVRVHEDPEKPDDLGPVRMAMRFTRFVREHERERLNGFLAHSGLRLAA